MSPEVQAARAKRMKSALLDGVPRKELEGVYGVKPVADALKALTGPEALQRADAMGVGVNQFSRAKVPPGAPSWSSAASALDHALVGGRWGLT